MFAADDLMALQTMHVAPPPRAPRPEDLSVIGFDNLPESALATADDNAADADVTTLVLDDKSGRPTTVRVASSAIHVPRPSGVQEDLAHAVIATGTPVVLVLATG
jgi:hypothetical protein